MLQVFLPNAGLRVANLDDKLQVWSSNFEPNSLVCLNTDTT